jgi:serine/threonine protein kinase
MPGISSSSESGDESHLSPVREGELVAKNYVAGKILGVGGMGIVIQAEDKVLGRKVAIKFLLPSIAHAERSVRRFIQEARVAARITSEHVVKLLVIDTLPSGTPFFVMEYLEGSDLRAILAQEGPLPSSRAVDYVLQALEAIAEGHQHGVVHRDLKPGNLFLTRRADGTELVKVLDFGIAKTLESDGINEGGLTRSDDVRLGSPAYMSPEQLQNPTEVDARADVWALGVTLHELLTGDHPFKGNTYLELVLSITSGRPEQPSKARPQQRIPRELDRVVSHCLERDKDRRYSSAAELAEALAPFGTEDGRASLRRIQRLTLPPVDSISGHETTTLASGVGFGRVRSTQRKRALVAAGILIFGVGVVYVVTRLRPEPTTTQRSNPPVPSEVVVPIAAAPQLAPSVSATEQASSVVGIAAESVKPSPRSQRKAIVVASAPTRSAPPVELVTPVPSSDPGVPSPRSARIEKNIETRR